MPTFSDRRCDYTRSPLFYKIEYQEHDDYRNSDKRANKQVISYCFKPSLSCRFQAANGYKGAKAAKGKKQGDYGSELINKG